MLDRVNKTPFSVELLPALDKDGAEYLVVAIKATFSVSRGGATRIAEEQAPVALADVHRGDPGKSSLLYDSDAALRKPGVDVVVVGSAHGPASGVSSMDVEVRVGAAHKTVRVFGPRVWARSGPQSFRPSLPGRIASVPLAWELAFGGTDDTHADPQRRGSDARNPVGLGFVVSPAASDMEGRPVPQLEDPAHLLHHLGDRPPPAGFGFIARTWAPRAAWAGTYDDAWRAERAPLLPLDFDDRHYLAAPAGLPVRELRGGEPVSVTGVLPGGARFDLAVPKHHIEVAVEAFATSTVHRARLDTLVLEPGASRALLTYRAAIPTRRRLLDIDRIRIREVAA